MDVVGCGRGIIVVIVALAAGGAARAGVTVAARAQPGPAYVGQGVALDVTIARDAGDPEPTLEPPRPPGAELIPLPPAPGPDPDRPGTTVRRFVLVPRRPGALTVGPFRARAGADRATASRPIALDVRPIPPAGRPAAFLGGVGAARVAAAVEPATVRVGQPVEVRITLAGPAAWGGARIPDLAAGAGLPPGFEIREATTQLDPDVPTRTFRYRLRPLRAGRAVLPPVALATFDPASGRFQTQVTPGLPVLVEPPPRFDPARVDFGPEPAPRRRSPAVAAGMVGLAALGLVGGALLGRRWRIRRRAAGPVRWAREAAELGRWAAGGDHPPVAVAAAIAARLAGALGRATGMPLAVLTPIDAEAAVTGLTRDAELARRARRLVDWCDRVRFDPGEPVAEAVALMRAIGQGARGSPVGIIPTGRPTRERRDEAQRRA